MYVYKWLQKRPCRGRRAMVSTPQLLDMNCRAKSKWQEPSNPPPAETNTSTATILEHVRVNAAAEYYNLPQLKELANIKIQNVIETAWSPDGFLDGVEEVYNSTNDKDLRKLVGKAAADHIAELICLERFVALEVDKDFTLGIIKCMSKAEKSLNRELTHEKRLHTNLKMKYVGEEDWYKLENCLQIIHNTDHCRNCGKAFPCYIERSGWGNESSFILRCSSCRCRHTNN